MAAPQPQSKETAVALIHEALSLYVEQICRADVEQRCIGACEAFEQ